MEPRCRTVLWLSLLVSLGACALMPSGGAQDLSGSPHAISLFSTIIPLNPEADDVDRVSKLVYRGGLKLTSADDRFGGLSGLIVSDDGETLMAVTDTGYWFRAKLRYKKGDLSGAYGAELAPLLNQDGVPLIGKTFGDSEGLIGTPSAAGQNKGPLLVSFERTHRVLSFDFGAGGFDARGVAQPINSALTGLKPNKGLEAIALLQDRANSLIAVSENTLDKDGNFIGWLARGQTIHDITVKKQEPYQLTDFAVLPGGDLLTLERRFNRVGGVGMRMRRINGADIQPRALLDGAEIIDLALPFTIDNMEGLAIRRDTNGRTLIYVVSDNNFSPLQRTLLLMFELVE